MQAIHIFIDCSPYSVTPTILTTMTKDYDCVKQPQSLTITIEVFVNRIIVYITQTQFLGLNLMIDSVQGPSSTLDDHCIAFAQ